VSPQQRKAILVLIDLLHPNRPSFDRVALFTVRAELPLVNVGMAVRASLAHVGENRLHVTLRAGNALM
jgi:hypothetical protein